MAKEVSAAESAVKAQLPVKEPQPAIDGTVPQGFCGPLLRLLSSSSKLDKLFMLIGTIGAMGNGLCWPLFAILFGDFSDAFGNPTGDFMGQITSIALKFVYLGIGAMVGSYLQSAFWMWAGHRQTARLRQLYLGAVLRQELAYFDTQATTGSLLQGLSDDTNTVQAAISEKAAHFIQHMTTFVAGIVVAFVGGWDMTLLMMAMMPLLAAVGALLAKVTTDTSAKITDAYQKASSGAQQALAQVRTVAAYGGEERSLKAYEDALVHPTAVNVKQSLMQGVALGSVNFILYCTYAAAFYYGAWRVGTGNYTGGQVMQVFIAALLGGFSLGQAAPVFSVFANGQAAGQRLFSVIDRKPSIDVEDNVGKELSTVSGRLELRDVVFAYPVRPDVKVFNGLCLDVPAGKTVALVGSSGSGKSTVVQLIERYYDPLAGAVLLDGVNIRDLNLRWLRSQIGLVSQEPTLFATTIFENIAMGKPGASKEEVEAAAAAANAHTFIGHLPLAYETQVGERGLQLSGGQKQRIAIARAILKNPKIMLLDEATSALDTHSERVVQAALDNMIVGRTTVVVAHRLSTIQNADLIAVVRQGEVVEKGSHAELIGNPDGAYTTLVKLQMAAAAKTEDGGASSDDVTEDDTVSVSSEAMEIPDTIIEVHDESGDSAEVALAAAASAGHADLANAHSQPLSKTGSIELRRVSAEKDARRGSADVGRRASADGGKDSGHKGLRHRKHRASLDNKGKDGKKDGEDKPKPEVVDVPFSRLAKLNKPEYPYGVVGVVGSIINGGIQPAFAIIIASFIALFFNTTPEDMLSEASLWSWLFFAVGCSALIGSTLQQWSFGKMGAALARRVRVMMLGSMLRQEIGWFDLDQNSSGTLVTKLVTDASYIRGAVGDVVGLFLQNIVTLAAGYAIAFAYDWRMALLITGALPFMIFGSILYYRNVAGQSQGADHHATGANQAVSDAFSSVRVVQAYNLQGHMTNLYQRMMAAADSKAQKQAHVLGILMGYSQLSIFAVYGLIIWFGGLEVDSGRVDFDGFLKSFLALLMAAMGIAQAQIGFPDIGKAKEAVQSVFPIIDRKSLIDPTSPDGRKEGPNGAAHIEGAIQLVNVTFSYPARSSVVVFKDFSLDIPAGKMVALVGESGSGKSTIVGLVLRFYDVLAGQVLVDGLDIKSYNLRWLRAQIGLVSQEPLLFATSVVDNIRYGKPDASMEEIEAAARAANAYDFIMALPDGFNTEVGERGVQLSGGQKQRVAIARAVLKNPKIMLLDEATSALDAHSERVVQDALDVIMVGRTSVVVAHRLSTIRNADKIALVYRGQVLEQGTHADLMAIPDGGYARLVAAQSGQQAPPSHQGSKDFSRSASKSNMSRSKSKPSLATPTTPTAGDKPAEGDAPQ